MKAKDVKPRKWLNPVVLFDDGEYSAIWGTYEGRKNCLGVRYNKKFSGDKIGYPRQGKNPLWYIEPGFLVKPLLQEFLKLATYKEYKSYIININKAIIQFSQQ